jgi:putative FmdB family regulatory protein
MPIYEYRCSSCGHELEALQKLSDAPLVACPSCSAYALVKQLSAAGFQLKGSGWYATDFKGGGGKPDKKEPHGESKIASDPKSGGDSKSGGEAKPESKPDGATKPESKPSEKPGASTSASAAGTSTASS